MSRTRRKLLQDLVYPVGICACLLLAQSADARADNPKDYQAVPATDQQQGSASIAALLAKLENQILADFPATSDTIAAVLIRLPNASPSDVKLVRAMPSLLKRRAGAEEAARHEDAAVLFTTAGDVLEHLLNETSPNYSIGQRTQQQVEPPGAATGNPSSSALTPLPDELAGVDHTSTGAAQAPPQSPAATLAFPPAVLAERASDRAVPGGAKTGDPQDHYSPAPISDPQQGSALVTDLLTKLQQQIAEDAPAASNTIVDILMLMPKASPADAKLVLATPSILAQRARGAATAGRQIEASRFAIMGDILGHVLQDGAPHDKVVQQALRQPEPPTAGASDSPSIAAAPAPLSDDLPHMDNTSTSAAYASSSSPASPQGQLTALLAEPASDPYTKVAAEPKSPATMPSPPNASASGLALVPAVEKSLVKRLADLRPDVRIVMKNRQSASIGNDTAAPRAVARSAMRAASPNVVSEAATVPPVVTRRGANPPGTKLMTATENPMDPRCRAITLKFEIGDEPSDAERSYLRDGCRHHG